MAAGRDGDGLPICPGAQFRYQENFLDAAIGHVYVHEMFDALTLPSLATPPRKGIGAHTSSAASAAWGQRFTVPLPAGCAVRAIPARTAPSPRMPTGQPPPCRRGRRDSRAARRSAPRIGTTISRSPKRRYPDLTPAARKFFNTPGRGLRSRNAGPRAGGAGRGDCRHDDTARTACRTRRDVFLALNSRLGALTRRDASHAAGDL